MPSKNQTIEATVTKKDCGSCGSFCDDQEGGSMGECRSKSPVLIDGRDKTAVFPKVLFDDWCLDWVAKPRKIEITINAKPALSPAHRIIKLTAENADLRVALKSALKSSEPGTDANNPDGLLDWTRLLFLSERIHEIRANWAALEIPTDGTGFVIRIDKIKELNRALEDTTYEVL